MVSAGWATLDVIPSVKGIAKELDKQTSGPMAAAGRTGGKRFGDAAGTEAGKGFRGRFSNALRGFNPLAGVAIGAGVVTAFTDVIGQASSAEQAVGGVQAVFGEFASQVISDSERAAQGLGLSATAYQELITLSGALLKNKGIEDYAEQARTLVEVGADLAAQFGGSTQEAVDALNAAMRGESDPIERYAISLNETAIKAELAKTGMDGLEGAALEQAKTQARLNLIMQQSADAQGAFGREADTLAGKQARLSAEWADMRTELGQKLLPVTAEFVGLLNDQALPALQTAGGLARDAVEAFRDLPTPVKAAATAFVALKAASAIGLTSGLAAGVRGATSAMDTLRLRTMLAADAYASARTVTRTFGNSTVTVASGVGRMSAALQGVRAAATGAGSALTRGLSGAMSLLGGPWGVAIVGATAVLGTFWSQHQKAKQEVQELTNTLDEQTGALTQNSREWAAKQLIDNGGLEAARKLGVSLDLVTSAALGNEVAMTHVSDAVEKARDNWQGGLGTDLMNSVLDVNETVDKGTAEWQLFAAATGKAKDVAANSAGAFGESEGAVGKLRDATSVYREEISKTRGELQKLIDREKERALQAIQSRRDNIALKETLAAAREEMRQGTRTLNTNTKAGQENMSALLDLAEQWSNSTPKVQNARGAYEQMRKKFIEVAEQMGASKREARQLAEELLNVPKTAKWRYQSEGYQERMREIERIKEAMATIPSAGLDYTPRGLGSLGPRAQYATGGEIGGIGTGTSDSNLIWASRGEFMQRKAAVDYYGVEFMRRLNALQVPKFANGGPIAPVRQSTSGGGVQVTIGQVVAHDYHDFMRQTQQRAQKAAIGGFGP